jgi:MFS family permease
VAHEQVPSASTLGTTPPFPQPPSGNGAGYRWFTAGVGSWFGAFGMQGVLFSWILVGELNAESEWVGISQTASMLPSVFLLMIGGATADRFDPRRLLIALHLLAPLPVLALAVAAANDALSIPLVITFALSMGILTAFGNPARDALLSRVAGADLMGAVSGMTAVQFGSQAVGSLVAGLARVIGSPTALCIHACVLLSGALFASRVPRRSIPDPASVTRAPVNLRIALHGIREGLAIIARSPELRGSLLAVFAVGLFFIGTFSVVLPLMIRDVYGGGVDQLAIAFTLFPLGTISGSLALRRFGLRRKGRSMLLALLAAAFFQACLGSGLPFWAFSVATYSWGLGGAVFINSSRTIFQEHAPAAFRGRVLAAYQLGFMGGGPIGAFASGFAISVVGLNGTFWIGAGMMTLLVLGMSLFSQLPRIE